MTKLLLGRLLPAGLAVGLLTTALSPLQPALRAFGIAADALGGATSTGGVQLPGPGELELSRSGGLLAALEGLLGSGQRQDSAKRQIEGLVDSLKEKREADARAALEAADAKKKKAKKAKRKAAAAEDAKAKTPEPEAPALPVPE